MNIQTTKSCLRTRALLLGSAILILATSTAMAQATSCPHPPGYAEIEYSGESSHCSMPDDTCTTNEVVAFEPRAWGYTLEPCDSYHWDFGDGTSSVAMRPTHVYATPGDYTIRLAIMNWLGETKVTRSIHLKSDCEAPSGEPFFNFSGSLSGCWPRGTPCMSGEEVEFVGTEIGAPMQACDSFEWDFGDGKTAVGRTVSHVFGPGDFVVTFKISNPSGEKSTAREVESFESAGPPPPLVQISAPMQSTFSTNVPISFSGIASPPDGILAYRWSFGDGGTANVASPSHAFTQPGTYSVSFMAMNAFWWSSPSGMTVTIVDTIPFKFVVPAIAHCTGANGARWRTDLEIYNPDAPDPLSLTLTYAATGDQKRIVISNSTARIDNVFSELMTTEGAGPLVIEGTSKHLPIVRARTYVIDQSGLPSVGQLTPAVQLLPLRSRDVSSAKKILTGIEMSDRSHTNIGLVDTSTSPISVTLAAFDEHGARVGQRTVALDPWQLVQLGRADLSTFDLPPNAPFTIAIEGPAGAFIAYASKIDNASNDPLYIEACDVDFLEFRAEQVVPAVGHLTTGSGTWQSDLLLYNPGAQIAVDLAYYDRTGAKIAEAPGVTLAPGQILHFDDVLRSGLFSPQPADSFGMIRMDIVASGDPALRPILQARTYNGSFGETISGATSAGNTTTGNDSLIVAIENDSRFATNLGVVNLSDESTEVHVSLLDWTTGQPIAGWTRELSPHESLIAPDAIADPLVLGSAAEFGTLRIHVSRGGPVWAWASIVERKTNDPEYIPAVPEN